LAVPRHLAGGRGARQAGRLVGVDKDTVARYGLRACGHGVELARLAAQPPAGPSPSRPPAVEAAQVPQAVEHPLVELPRR
jgi:hypothetical protein